ncbi:hypothetical protein lerEdw1_008737 [Lerista edwardsae]|nr:hypothetical protein lerEdw1_008737 [Lerista edwardsae]
MLHWQKNLVDLKPIAWLGSFESMEAVGKLLYRLLLLFLLSQHGFGRSQQAPTTPDPSGVTVVLDKMLRARCGYVLTEDVWGNTIFRASLLGCHVINERDERFTLTVSIRVSSFKDLRAATVYRYPMQCTYSPWAPREIVCEENYMEVSVKSDVPVISDDGETAEWMSALPEVQKVVYQIWQLIFYSPLGRKTTAVSDADKLGYSFNNTLARVFLRSPYSTDESELSVVNGVAMSTVSSTSMYKQRWLLLLIDTTVSCPVGKSDPFGLEWGKKDMHALGHVGCIYQLDGTSFTDSALTWTVPTIIPKLVLQETTFISYNISMGVDERRIANPESLNYALECNITHIEITIPIGANGGRLKSAVSNGVHGVTYSINLFLEHTWTDMDWHLTKYTVIKQITTPFMPRIPTVVNNTVPDTRLFDIAFGVFLPDVSLLILTVGDMPLTPEEVERKGYKSPDTTFPNGTKSFNLKVPFDDPSVIKEYVNKNETKYRLRVNYTLNVGPEKKPYHHPADIECVIADIELPEGVGYCDKQNMYLAVPTEGLHQHWSLYVGNKPLSRVTALSNGYLITTNDTHLVLRVPLFAVGVIYEEVSFESIKTRFDLALKKTITLETLDIFSVRCNFNPLEFIVCYPNGTVTVSALMKTVPSIDMSKTRLKDNTCKPKEFTKERAFFQFHVSTCGTSLRFEGERLIYENEISFEKETLPVLGPPTITRDPEYRLTVLCYYATKEILMQSAVVTGSPSATAASPFGYGTMIARSRAAGLRRGRQVLSIISNFFQDKSFAEIYEPHSMVVKSSWDPIFLEFELKDDVPDAELFLDDCWLTGSEEFSRTSQWNIIVDGQVAVAQHSVIALATCKNNHQGSVLDFYPVIENHRVKYPKHFKRVGIQMQIPLNKVYIHCTVTVSACLAVPDNGFSCRQQCPSGRKPELHFESHPNLHGYVVAGPVFVIHPDQM